MNERFKEKNLNTSVLTVLLKTGRQPQRTRPSRGYSYISMARPRPENVECEDGVIAASVAASGDKARDLESGQHEIKTEHCHGDSKEKLEGKTCMGESLFDHPVYKTISKVNGVINRMHKEELVTKLGELNLNSRYTNQNTFGTFNQFKYQGKSRYNKLIFFTPDILGMLHKPLLPDIH